MSELFDYCPFDETPAHLRIIAQEGRHTHTFLRRRVVRVAREIEQLRHTTEPLWFMETVIEAGMGFSLDTPYLQPVACRLLPEEDDMEEEDVPVELWYLSSAEFSIASQRTENTGKFYEDEELRDWPEWIPRADPEMEEE